MPQPDWDAILTALSRGVAGDPDGGLQLLQPVVDGGPQDTWELLCMLAEIAAEPARRSNAPGAFFTLNSHGPNGPTPIDAVPPDVRFAGQFVTAWANRDQASAAALFQAVAEHSDTHRTEDLGRAIGAVYDMAIAATSHLVGELRQQVEQQ